MLSVKGVNHMGKRTTAAARIIGSLGGKARAKILSKRRKTQIARMGGAAFAAKCKRLEKLEKRLNGAKKRLATKQA